MSQPKLYLGTTMSKMICPECQGNGYRRIWKDADQKEKIEIDCKYCKNQGEVYIDEDTLQKVRENGL